MVSYSYKNKQNFINQKIHFISYFPTLDGLVYSLLQRLPAQGGLRYFAILNVAIFCAILVTH